MATNGDFPDDDSQPGSPVLEATNQDFDDNLDQEKPLKSAMKKSSAPAVPQPMRPELPEQPNPETLDFSTLTPLSPEVISRQASINVGTVGHVAQFVHLSLGFGFG